MSYHINIPYELDVLSGLPDAERGTKGAAVALSLSLAVRCKSEVESGDPIGAFCTTCDSPLVPPDDANPAAGAAMTLLCCTRNTDISTG